MIGGVLAFGAAVALIGLGAAAWIAPRACAAGYGIPVAEPAALAFVQAAGVRDLVLGFIVGVLGVAGARPLLVATFACLTLVAVADLMVVYRVRRPELPGALLVHGIGAATLPLVAAVIAAGW